MGQTDRVAIVTRGSRGIGRATALTLASSVHRVLLSFREREQDAQAVASRIRDRGGEARSVAFLLSEAASYVTCRVVYVNGGGPSG